MGVIFPFRPKPKKEAEPLGIIKLQFPDFGFSVSVPVPDPRDDEG